MKTLYRPINLLALGWLAAAGVFEAQNAAAQEETYYYRKGEKVTLKIDPSKSYVLLKPDTDRETLVNVAKSTGSVLKRFETVQTPKALNLTQDPPAEPPKWAIIDNIDLTAPPLAQGGIADGVLYEAPFFLTTDGKQVGMSHLIYVKLKEETDRATLEKLAGHLKVQIVGNNKLMPLWYTLSCSKETEGNALQVANKLFETGDFAVAEPDFLADFQIKRAEDSDTCATDEHFGVQWGLKNTGQNGGTAGMDIRACDAWGVATGKGVNVAVLDHGIQLDHPDLQANVSADSFDTVNATSPSLVRGNHGTACAGIIGAVRNNGGEGVAGVAPEATLISISHTLAGVGPNQQQELATGLAWAWQNGADVISNSWGHDLLASAFIDDAIENALTQGRGGKGCVVVFAAGNSNSAVIYPASSNPAILAVAAMSPCGERKSPSSCDPETWWGSCFGNPLDVTAPGVLIPMTDRTGGAGYDSGDYTLDFNGTSSATPHVAGIAALMLEVNPDLTQKEVVDIIEKTARKVGPYKYGPEPGRPNGDWHQEMGHGLVDATACVQAAMAGRPKN